MKKRLISLALCLVLCLSTCSCAVFENITSTFGLQTAEGISEDVSLGYKEVGKMQLKYSPYYERKKCTYSYDSLESVKQKELYNKLYESAFSVYPKVSQNGSFKTKQVILEDATLSEAKVRIVVKALTDDNPDVFWVSGVFGYLVSDSKNYTAVQLYSLYSHSKLTKMISEMESGINSVFSSFEDNMSEYDRELYIHDTIIDMCKYDESISEQSIGSGASFSAYGVFALKLAVCEGYSRAFQLLCNGVGVDCVNVIGMGESELHMWNAVLLDGDWYYVDPTWDDIEDEYCRYDYFNINETQLLNDHEYSPLVTDMTDEQICGTDTINAQTANLFIPDCTESSFNYYVRTAPHLTDYDSADVRESLYLCAKRKDDYLHIYIDPDEFTYDNAISSLFESYPQYFFTYADDVNARLSDYSIDQNNLSIVRKQSLNVVTVKLSYI